MNGVCTREELSDWEQLLSDFVHEELWRNTLPGSHSKTESEENFALAGKGGKSNGEKGSGGSESSSKGEKKKKKDLSKIKCFSCHQFGHYATKCSNLKNGSQMDQVVDSAKIDEFSSSFEKEFSLIACKTSLVGINVWYIDNRASCHMMGNKDYFCKLTEKDMKFHIELGDDGR